MSSRDWVLRIEDIFIHEYFSVSVPILWQTVNRSLAPLVPELKRVLSGRVSVWGRI